MITIFTEGGNQRQRDLAEDAVCFYIKELMPQKRKMHIFIKLSRCLNKNEGLYSIVEETVSGYKKGGTYEITVDSSLTDEDFLISLAHECVHIKQFFRRELRHLNAFDIMWKEILVETRFVNYWKQPWEIEAHDLEEKLFSRLSQSSQLHK